MEANFINQLEQILSDGKTGQAIRLLKTKLNAFKQHHHEKAGDVSDFGKQLILISAKYQRIEENNRLGKIAKNDYSTEFTNITAATIDLADSIPQYTDFFNFIKQEDEKANWNSIKYSNSTEVLRRFLEKYPDGNYTSQALQRIEDLVTKSTQNEQNISEEKQNLLEKIEAVKNETKDIAELFISKKQDVAEKKLKETKPSGSKQLPLKWYLIIAVSLLVIIVIVGVLYSRHTAFDRLIQEGDHYLQAHDFELARQSYQKADELRKNAEIVQKKNEALYRAEWHYWWDNIGTAWQEELSEHKQWTAPPDASQIADLQTIDSLNIAQNKRIRHLLPLKKLKNIRILVCYDTEISNLEMLRHCQQLEFLNCSETKITNLQPLSGLLQLRRLLVSQTGTTTLDPLSNLQNLEYLDCSQTNINSLEPLAGLYNLVWLNCRNTAATNLQPLYELPVLAELHLSNIEYDQVSDFREHQPDCKVVQYNEN